MTASVRYSYAGRSNLNASELLFIIFCEKFAEQFGIDDFVAITAIYLGKNNQELDGIYQKYGKFHGATKGTSRASKISRKLFGKVSFPYGIRLPTLILKSMSPFSWKVLFVRRIGTFVGRTIPLVGWAIAAEDISEITHNTVSEFDKVTGGAWW